jgi:hypothetical protein
MPTLDQGFEVFANWQTVVFCLGIYILTYVCRTVVQHFWKGWKANKLYTELVLHLFPILVGGGVGWVAKKFPWPMPIADSASARIMYGAILGMFCGLVYNRVRAWFQLQTGKPLPAGGAVPDPPVVADDTEDDDELPEAKPKAKVEAKAEVKADAKVEAKADAEAEKPAAKADKG